MSTTAPSLLRSLPTGLNTEEAPLGHLADWLDRTEAYLTRDWLEVCRLKFHDELSPGEQQAEIRSLRTEIRNELASRAEAAKSRRVVRFKAKGTKQVTQGTPLVSLRAIRNHHNLLS